MIRDQWCLGANDVAQSIEDRCMVVEPGVCAEIAAQIILVSGAMPAIAAAAGYQLHLRAGRAVEVGGLVGYVDLEFLNALYRRRHYARGPATGRRGSIARSVGVLSAVHVAAVVAAVELEGVLVADGAGHGPVRRDGRLQRQQAGNVAAKIG